MKIRNSILLSFVGLCICCTQKSYTNNSFLYQLRKEIPELILINGMEYIGNHNCEGSPDSTDASGVYVGSFYISKHEITNKDFCYFLNEDSIRQNDSLIKAIIAIGAEQNKIELHDGQYRSVKGFEQYPVVMVSWWGAKKYCAWLTAYVRSRNVKSDRYYITDYRLPTEFEWVFATSVNKKQYDFIVPPCAETIDSQQQFSFPARNVKKDSLGQYGVAGMNENVYEWTDDNFYIKYTATDYSMNSPYQQVITPYALVHQYGSSPLNHKSKRCGRISRLRTGFYSDTGFRIVQTHLGRSSGFEF